MGPLLEKGMVLVNGREIILPAVECDEVNSFAADQRLAARAAD